MQRLETTGLKNGQLLEREGSPLPLRLPGMTGPRSVTLEGDVAHAQRHASSHARASWDGGAPDDEVAGVISSDTQLHNTALPSSLAPGVPRLGWQVYSSPWTKHTQPEATSQARGCPTCPEDTPAGAPQPHRTTVRQENPPGGLHALTILLCSLSASLLSQLYTRCGA